MLTPFLDHAIDPDTLILTVNRRLARTLTRQHDRQRLAAGERVWPTPRIMPLTTWLEQCWEHLLVHLPHPPDRLLSAWQERLIWEGIVGTPHHGYGGGLGGEGGVLHPSEAAKNAQDAWRLLQEWQVTLTPETLHDHEDAQAFHHWSTHFVQVCQTHRWLEPARLPAFLMRYLDHLPLPKQLVLAGFQRITPAHRALFSAMDARSVTAWSQANHPDASPPRVSDGHAGRRGAMRVGFPSSEEERRAAAHWAHGIVRTQPHTTIGIVIPHLAGILSHVVTTFARVFYPGKNPATLDPRTQIFNISLGAPLSETPLVRDALQFLALRGQEIALERYTSLLHSPFLKGGTSERQARSLLDARLRQKGWRHVTVRALQREATRKERASPPCPVLAATLARFLKVSPEDGPASAPLRHRVPSAWVIRFSEWLAVLGWPGEYQLSSAEYQTVSAWHKALALFSTLDSITGRLSLTDAWQTLKRMLGEMTFQPESREAPIQILGLLEAVGERYDHLWILGLSDDVWPPPMEPNPFLPMALQRRHGMPHASFEVEMAYHRPLLEGLLASAGQVVVSYPSHCGEQPVRPSPLIVSLPVGEIVPHVRSRERALALVQAPDYNQVLFEAAKMTVQPDWRGPPFSVDKPVGTRVLQAQASCPFRAFVQHRLGAEPINEPAVGLDPAKRGQLVHGALAQLWDTMRHTDTSVAEVMADPDRWIGPSVHKTVQRLAQQWPGVCHPFLYQLEEARLARLLSRFLEVEQSRQRSFTVQGQEVVCRLRLGPLDVHMRLDRVDRLQDGGALVVLDYKTGQVSETDWLADRPSDPQLPLYVLAQTEPVVALAFYQVRAGACRLWGLACQDGLLPGVRTVEAWTDLQAHWRTVFTQLAEAFVAGHAEPDPLPKNCRYCTLRAVCRADEWQVGPMARRKTMNDCGVTSQSGIF